MTQDEKNGEIKRLQSENLRQRRALEELAILNEIATAINSTLSLERIMDLIVQKCLKFFQVEQGAILLLDEDKEKPFQTMVRKGATTTNRLPYRLDDQLTGWMLKNKALLLISNFQSDERFRQAAANEAASLRSLLAVPLLLKGQMTGLITVINKKSAEGFNDADQRLLAIVASQSSQVIENARLLEKEQKLIRIQEELRLAHDIQIQLLPAVPPRVPGYDIDGRSLPAKEVGGDYFDFIHVNDHRLAFCIGDVSGKGMPAALLMSHLQAAVRGQSLLQASCSDCVHRANRLLYHSTGSEKFASLFYGILDPVAHRICFCNAGHNYPFLISGDKKPRLLDTGGIVLGCLELFDFAEQSVSLKPQDLLLLYSDGISEALDSAGNEFGEQRLLDIALENRQAPAAKLLDTIMRAVQHYSGKVPQFDDMTLVAIRREK